jgi:hypothetical protein
MQSFYHLHRGTSRGIVILVVQGGNNAELVRHYRLCKADLVIVIDVEKELARLLTGVLPPHVKFFALGPGHTARTLAEGASPAIQCSIGNTAGMNAESGLGQLRALGYLATKLLLESQEMQSFLSRDLLDFLMKVSGGVLDSVLVVCAGSVAGGTASAGLLFTVAAIEQSILERTNATVEVELHITGAISYAGLGPRVHKNAAAGVVEALAYVTARHQHNRTIRSLRLTELPPCGDDRAARARYMLEMEQAAQCAAVGEILDRNAPNNSQNGPLGNVTIWRSGHFSPLHPRNHVARDIAPGYFQLLRQLLLESNPHPSLIGRLTLATRRQALPREGLDGILDRAATTDINDLIAAVAQPGFKLTIAIDAILASGESLRLSDARTVWAAMPGTMAETHSRLILQSTCLRVLDHEIAKLETQLAQTEHRGNLLARALTRNIKVLRHPSLWSRLKHLLFDTAPSADVLGSTAGQFRTAVEQMQQLKDELDALRNAHRLVEAEHNYLTERIAAIMARLDALVPRGQRQQSQPMVVAKPIDAVLPDLLQLTDEMTDEHISGILLSAVDQVTEHGLATITGANPPRLEVIASRIVQRRFTLTPPWAGKPRMLDGREIHVLPPLSPETADKLRQLIGKHDPTITLVIAERMPASINCVTLYASPVTSLDKDVFTQYLRRSLLEACRDENPETYFPSGTAALDELGITIDGEVTFRPTTNSQRRNP